MDGNKMQNDIDAMMGVAEATVPSIAKLLGKLRDELIENGFSKAEAVVICSNYKLN